MAPNPFAGLLATCAWEGSVIKWKYSHREKGCAKMKRITKYAAMLLTALFLTATLTGCSASGSNAGVWIAVIVMVFIAVFAATSGVVYLVLQKILPPEKPAARTHRAREYVSDIFDEDTVCRPVNPARSATGSGSVWVCPRDKSRNTGPYCAVCGGKRPVPPRPAVRPGEDGSAPQRPIRAPQGASGVNQQPPRTTGSPYGAEQPGYADQQFRKPQQPPAPVRRSPDPAPQEEVQEYRGAFARPAKSEPPAQDAAVRSEPSPLDEARSKPSALDAELNFDVDSELLEAIFREAAQGNDEE